MPFVVLDLQDLIGLLEQHPQWKSALRASLLGDDLLRLSAAMLMADQRSGSGRW
jgi:hypothetical protein